MKFYIDNLPVSDCRQLLDIRAEKLAGRLPIRQDLPRCAELRSRCSAHTENRTEQYQYMCDLKRTLDAGVCLLNTRYRVQADVSHRATACSRCRPAQARRSRCSLLLSRISRCARTHSSAARLDDSQHFPERRKLIYCSRTVPEIEKALAELKRLMEYRRDREGLNETFLGLGLTSRKNLCVHPDISREKKGKAVDARCRDLTSAWVSEKNKKEPGSVEVCDWHEKLGELEPGSLLPAGVFTLDEVKAYGIRHGICPYFAVRRMVRSALLFSLRVGIITRTAPTCRRHHLLISLSSRSQGRRAGLEGDVEGRHRRLRRGAQHRYVALL